MVSNITRAAIHHEQTSILQTYARPEIVLERGEGVYLYDTEGKRYLDFLAGIGVNALGYGNADIVHALQQQASSLIHTSNLYHTIPGGELATLLLEHAPAFQRVFFCNSGAEAVEGTLKFARKYAREHHGEGKTTVVAFDGSFHGRTMGALAITSREKYRQPFVPLMPDVRFATFNDLEGLETAIRDDVCAVIVEPVQGEGGLRVASTDFLARLREVCNAHGALLIFDEIQCGMGRTGTLWAHEPSHISPDMMTLAKPLAAGLPIGAILLNQQVADVIAVGDHATTFGGGPLITSLAQVVVRRISDAAFLAHVNEVSAYLDRTLQHLATTPGQVAELRGRGLMRGIRINGSASTVRQACQEAGLLVGTSGDDVLRLLPPLIIDRQHVDEAAATIETCLG